MTKYICPNCKSDDLTRSEESYKCGACEKRYHIRGGIPVFREGEAQFYWGTAQTKMEGMIATAKSIGWHDAMMDFLSEGPLKEAKLVWNRTFGSRRLAMNMLLPLQPSAKVLDIGSGWGTIAMHLSRYCDQVTAMDQMSHHLEWIQLACQAMGINNLTLVQSGDTKYLPFPPDSFDVVILNGVLEWAASNTTGHPGQVQQRFVSDIARVLKPSGVLYIGIENRWNYRYFKGTQEGHIRMKYGALLPRFMTDLYLRITRGVPYREYTYTLFGYRQLLAKAGLGHRRFYSTWPHYGSIDFVLPLEKEGDEVSKNWVVKTEHRFARRPFSYFSRAFVMTASRDTFSPSLSERIIDDLISRTGWASPITLDEALFRVTSTGKAIVKVLNQSGATYLLKVGLVPEAGAGIGQHHSALAQMFEQPLDSKLENKLPQPLLVGELSGFVYAVESFYARRDGSEIITEKTSRERLCEDAFDFITRLTIDLGSKVKVDEEVFETYFSIPLSSIRHWFTKQEWEDKYASWTTEVTSRIRQSVLNKQLVITPRHGDFVPANCLVDAQGRLDKVLDWELYEHQGLPLYDWITFLGCAHRPSVREDIRAQGIDPKTVKFPGYPAIFMDGELNQQLVRYLETIGMDKDLLAPLLFMWWVKQLQDWEEYHLYHPEWRRLRVFPVIERLKALVERV